MRRNRSGSHTRKRHNFIWQPRAFSFQLPSGSSYASVTVGNMEPGVTNETDRGGFRQFEYDVMLERIRGTISAYSTTGVGYSFNVAGYALPVEASYSASAQPNLYNNGEGDDFPFFYSLMVQDPQQNPFLVDTKARRRFEVGSSFVFFATVGDVSLSNDVTVNMNLRFLWRVVGT